MSKPLKFAVEGQPELEVALNLLAERISAGGSDLQFSDTPHIKARRDGSVVSFDLFSVPGDKLASKAVPLHVLSSRPQYIVNPESPPAEGSSRLWVEWGSINNVLATNWDDYFDLTANAFIYADITLNTTSATELITSWEIATGSSVPAQPQWPESGPSAPVRPAKLYILLGTYFHAAKTVSNSGGGSLVVGEYVIGITPTYGVGGTVLQKALTWSRLTY